MIKKTISYLEFSRDWHQKIWQEGKLCACQIELTHYCNHRCLYCYIPENSLRGEFTSRELSYFEWRDFLDYIHKQGVQWISFTGGDPFQKDDFLNIYTYAKKKGFFITILTNAGNITPEIANYLSRYRPFSIDITLNSLRKDTFERISQIPGSFEKTLEGIELLRNKNLPFKIKTKLITLNYNEVEEFKKFAWRLKVKWTFSYKIAPRLNGDRSPLSYRLPPEKILEILSFQNPDGGKEPMYSLEKIRGQEKEEVSGIKNNPLYRCALGNWSFAIDPYGKIFPCSLLRQRSFPFHRGKFIKELEALFRPLKKATFYTDSKCKNCRWFRLCQWCPALANLETGEEETPIEYFCRLTSLLVRGGKKG